MTAAVVEGRAHAQEAGRRDRRPAAPPGLPRHRAVRHRRRERRAARLAVLLLPRWQGRARARGARGGRCRVARADRRGGGGCAGSRCGDRGDREAARRRSRGVEVPARLPGRGRRARDHVQAGARCDRRRTTPSGSARSPRTSSRPGSPPRRHASSRSSRCRRSRARCCCRACRRVARRSITVGVALRAMVAVSERSRRRDSRSR